MINLLLQNRFRIQVSLLCELGVTCFHVESQFWVGGPLIPLINWSGFVFEPSVGIEASTLWFCKAELAVILNTTGVMTNIIQV